MNKSERAAGGLVLRLPSLPIRRRRVDSNLALERISIACPGSTTGGTGARGKENEGLSLLFFIPVIPVPPVVIQSLSYTDLKSDLEGLSEPYVNDPMRGAQSGATLRDKGWRI